MVDFTKKNILHLCAFFFCYSLITCSPRYIYKRHVDKWLKALKVLLRRVLGTILFCDFTGIYNFMA